MKDISKKKLVLFGAGKIGRSFIGQLFSRGGYEVVFIDVCKPIIDELNRRRSYNVVIKNDEDTVLSIQNVRGVLSSDVDQVTHEIETATIMGVSVGSNALKFIIPLIAEGLIKRSITQEALPLDIIIAENLRNAAEFIHKELKKNLPEGYPLEQMVGLIETSIGKMVPIIPRKDMEEDMLQVFAEPYNTLILDKLAFKNPIPEIEGLAPKNNIKAWVDRKLFIHNLGHATTAYLGFLAHPSFTFIYEVLSDSQLKDNVRNTMLQASDILVKEYPEEFTRESLTLHIDDLLKRFQNKALGDTLYRVGCDLQRKLGTEDRLAGALHLALKLKLPYDLILRALVCGCHFKATDENGNWLPSDLKFMDTYKSNVKEILKSVSGFDETVAPEVISEAIVIDNFLKDKFVIN